MSSIDERIVQMKFLNSDFEKGIQKTTESLSKLKTSLKLENATSGLQRLKEAGNRFSLSNISNQLSDISSKFSALGAAGVVALGNIATQAINTGLQIAKSLTIAPVSQGYADYEAKLTSVQTITAATGRTIADVETYFNQLDTYADKTIYNLSDMTGALAKFVNAGVDLETAVPAIKGISNMTALAGQGAGAAAIAYYNLSQSIAGGFLTTTDYKSLNLANIATKEWKNQMVQAAVEAGTLKETTKGIYQIKGSRQALGEAQLFTQGLSEQWATTEILLGVLGEYGDVNTAIGKKAQASAQDIKSYAMMMETLKASVGTGWTDTFQIIIGNLEESKKLWTGVTTTIQSYIDKVTDARNKLFQGWKDLGGRTALLEGLGNIFATFEQIILNVGKAFKEVFPTTTSKQLFDITEAFKNFTKGLKNNWGVLYDLKRTLRGVFAIFGIVWEVVKAATKAFFSLFGATSEGASGILKFTGNIGDFLYGIQQALKEGSGLTKFFSGIAEIIKVPIAIITAFVTVLNGLFSGVSAANESLTGATSNLQERLNPLESIGQAVANIWDKVVAVFKKVGEFFKPLTDAISAMFDGLPSIIKDGFNKINYNSVFDVFNTGLLAGLVVLVAKIFNNGLFFGKINGFFKNLSNTLQTFQNSLKAKTLLMLAIAVATLAGAAIALSLVDSEKLSVSLAAIGVLFTQLLAGLSLFTKISTGWKQIPFITAGLINLAIAINILVAAVVKLSKLNWEQLAKGLIGVTALLGILVIATKTLNTNAKGMISAGIAIAVLAVGIRILASSVVELSKLNWDDLGRGLAGLTAILAVVAVFVRATQGSASFIGAAIAMLILSAAIKILVGVISDLSKMSYESIVKGLIAMQSMMVAIAAAVRMFPKNTLIVAFGLLMISTALVIMAKALSMFGDMTWDEIGRGLTVMAASLAILAGALYLMSGSLPGAFALLIAASALAILAVPLKILSSMSWAEIGQGLGFLAGALLIIAGAGYLLIGALPGLLGLGGAILLVGIGTLAAGIGISLLAAAIGVLVVSLTAGSAVLLAFITSLIKLIPFLAQMIGQGLIEIIKVIGDSGEVLLSTLVVLLMTLITAVQVVIPPLVKTIFDLVWLLLDTLQKNLPRFIKAGANILISLLNGIAQKLPDIINAGANLVIAFLKGLANEIGGIIDEGIKVVIAFIDGIAEGIKNNTKKFVEAGSKLFRAIVDGISEAVKQGGSDIKYAGEKIGEALIEGAKNAMGINSPSKEFYKIGESATEGLVNGLNKTSSFVGLAAENVGQSAIDGLNKSLNDISVMSDVNLNPVIRPVLDLTSIKKDSKNISSMLQPASLSVDTAYAQASSIAMEQRAIKAQSVVSTEETSINSDTNITFIQNNNSPKALSASEIYRQTKNQISAVKLTTAV